MGIFDFLKRGKKVSQEENAQERQIKQRTGQTEGVKTIEPVEQKTPEQVQYENLLRQYFPKLDEDIEMSQTPIEEMNFCMTDLSEKVEMINGQPIVTARMILEGDMEYYKNAIIQNKILLKKLIDKGNDLLRELMQLSEFDTSNQSLENITLHNIRTQTVQRQLAHNNHKRNELKAGIINYTTLIKSMQFKMERNTSNAQMQKQFPALKINPGEYIEVGEDLLTTPIEGESKSAIINGVECDVQFGEIGEIGTVCRFSGVKEGKTICGIIIDKSQTSNNCLVFENGKMIIQYRKEFIDTDCIIRDYTAFNGDFVERISYEHDGAYMKNIRNVVPCVEHQTGEIGRIESLVQFHNKYSLTPELAIRRDEIIFQNGERKNGFEATCQKILSQETAQYINSLQVISNGESKSQEVEENPIVEGTLHSFLTDEIKETIATVTPIGTPINETKRNSVEIIDQCFTMFSEEIKRRKEETKETDKRNTGIDI